MRLESFQIRIHPIPSFSNHINRALLILLPSNLPLKVWYVSLNYFQPRIHPTPSSGCPQKQLFFPSNSAQRFVYVRLNFSCPESTLYHHLALYKNPGPSSHQIVLKAFASVRLESFQTRIYLCVRNVPNPHPPCTIKTCKSTKTGLLFFFPSNCPPSFVSVRLDSFHTLLIHPAHHHCLLLPAPVPIPLGPSYSFFPPQLDKTSKYPSPDRLAYSILLHLLLLNSTHISTRIKILEPRTTLNLRRFLSAKFTENFPITNKIGLESSSSNTLQKRKKTIISTKNRVLRTGSDH